MLHVFLTLLVVLQSKRVLEFLPAKVRWKDIQDFLFGDERVESVAVRSINHVALVCSPPVKGPIINENKKELRG